MLCLNCGNEFRGRFKQKYCSDKCRREGWKQYLANRYAKKEEIILKERIAYIRRLKSQNSSYLQTLPDYSPLNNVPMSVLNFLIELAQRQQFAPQYIMKDGCEACKSKTNLMGHHISYFPPEEVTLCSKCHDILHKQLLGKKRIKPRNI